MPKLKPAQPPAQPNYFFVPKHTNFGPSYVRHKTYLITGAAHGIGRALALQLAQMDAYLVLLDKDAQGLDALAEQIQTQWGQEPIIAAFDLCQMDQDIAQELAQSLHQNTPRLDGIFHLAGMLGALTPLNQYPQYLWQQVMKIHLDSAWMITQALMPLLRQAEQAQVVFTSAQEGIIPKAYWGAYAVSKASLLALTKVWADETRQTSQVRFNIVDPGIVATQLRSTAYPAEDPSTLASPEQALTPYLYLLSDAHDMSLSGAVLLREALD